MQYNSGRILRYRLKRAYSPLRVKCLYSDGNGQGLQGRVQRLVFWRLLLSRALVITSEAFRLAAS